MHGITKEHINNSYTKVIDIVVVVLSRNMRLLIIIFVEGLYLYKSWL